MKTYESVSFSTRADWSRVPVSNIDCFPWETADVFRPQSRFQLCFVENTGVYVRLWSDQTAPRRVHTLRDAPVYEDDCLEFFFALGADTPYLNVEMNANGAYLAQFGATRNDRAFVKDLTALSPAVTPLDVKDGWGVECFLSCALLGALFQSPFVASPGTYRGNFYKCGDKTAVPHYAAFAPIAAAAPDFHRPAQFATIEIRKESLWNH